MFEIDDQGLLVGYNGSMRNVAIPEGVFGIASGVFLGHDEIQEVHFPATITHIGHRAFYGCVSLKEIYLPESVRYIGKYAFYGCECLEVIEIVAEKIDEMGKGVVGHTAWFDKQCGLIRLGDWVLGYRGSEETLSIPEGVRHIIEEANFCDGSSDPLGSVREIRFPDSLETIGKWVFAHKGRLEKVDPGAGVKRIGDYSFSGIKSLSEVKNGSALTDVGRRVFSDTKWSVNCGTAMLGNILIDFSDMGDEMSFPEQARIIAPGVYSGHWQKHLVIPQSVECIGKGAFAGSKLESVLISSKHIDEDAFCGCRSLKYVTLEDTVESIADNAFEDCPNIQVFIAPDKIGNRQEILKLSRKTDFLRDRTVEELQEGELNSSECLSVSDYQKWLDDKAEKRGGIDFEQITCIIVSNHEDVEVLRRKGMLQKCINTQRFIVSNGVSEIAQLIAIDGVLFEVSLHQIALVAFPRARSGRYIVPEGTTNICRGAFTQAQISKVVMPKSLRVISGQAFYWCAEIEELHIPRDVIIMGGLDHMSIAVACKRLRSISVDRENPYYFSKDGVLYDHYGYLICYPAGKAGKYTPPSFCVGYGDLSFLGCDKLTDIRFPKKMQELGRMTFAWCSQLEAVYLPEQIEKVDLFSFVGCENLEYLYIENPRIEISQMQFLHFLMGEKLTIHMPNGEVVP